MPRDIAILKKINYPSQSDTVKRNIGTTDFVFSVYENDAQFTSGKQIRLLEGTDKLIQGILKILLTPLGSSLEDSGYGTNLDSGVGSKLQQENYADLRTGVFNALEHYQQMNQDNDNPDEIIQEIDEVKAVRDDIDPRVILIYISVITQSGKLVNVVAPQVQ